MRIESYIQVQQMYQTSKPVKSNDASKSGFSDKLMISAKGKDIQVAKQAVENSADVREDKLAPIRTQLQSGTYEVSDEAFADKIVDKYFATLA